MTVEALRERILRGDYPEGEPLRQDALADELGVSRIPVREALRQLEAEGLVTFSPHRGAVVSTRDVQRCTATPPQARPDYWDVTYHYRGVEHHMQTTSPPGPMVTVNEAGEPRM